MRMQYRDTTRVKSVFAKQGRSAMSRYSRQLICWCYVLMTWVLIDSKVKTNSLGLNQQGVRSWPSIKQSVDLLGLNRP